LKLTGPASDWDLHSPYVCTDCDASAHSRWLQIFMDSDSAELFRIEWQFTGGVKTLALRFNHAVAHGEPVPLTSPTSEPFRL
jgi:hypothetical protein